MNMLTATVSINLTGIVYYLYTRCASFENPHSPSAKRNGADGFGTYIHVGMAIWPCAKLDM